MGLENRMTVVLIHSFKHDIEIVVKRGADIWHGRGLLAGMVEAPHRRHGTDLLAAFIDVKHGPLAEVVGRIVFSVGTADEGEWADVHLVAVGDVWLLIRIER